ncbi:MAG TPA: hypothetical protein PK702_04700 [Burkholderiaceae bacterium]|nr:hypothetical protein [Burkholderiaceae bacterium]
MVISYTHLFTIVFTVAMLAISVYFLLGSIPLLILKHDTPVDSIFIRSFFNLYYKVAIFVAAGAALSYAFSNRMAFAIGAAVISALCFMLRRTVIAKMDALKAHIHADNIEAIPEFRKIHFQAIQVSFVLLITVVWSLFSFTL